MRISRIAVGAAVAITALLPSTASAAITTHSVAGGVTATQLAQALAGPGVTVSNAAFTGAPEAGGTFAGGTPSIGFDGGVVLSTGRVADAVGPNDDAGKGSEFGTPGDGDLSALIGQETNDAAVLQFDFVPTTTKISFSYVFASEEYNEFVGQFNDVFAFSVNGHNCALVPGTSDPVSVNSINNGSHSALYRDNTDGHLDTQMDGLTTTLTCTAQVSPGMTNHMKLAIADALDSALDSDVFLKADSLISGTPPTAHLVATPSSGTAPLAVTFSTAGTGDAEGPIAFWQLAFGDGSSVFGSGPPPATFNFTYTTPGSYTATLSVTDGEGTPGTASEVVTATSANHAPHAAVAASPASGPAGTAVTFSTAGTNDPDGAADLKTWTLAFGDGSTLSGSGAPVATTSHTYLAPGTYTATLTVRDKAGATDARSVIVTVTKAATRLVADPAVLRLTLAPQPGSLLGLLRLTVYLQPQATLTRVTPSAPLAGRTVVFRLGNGSVLCSAQTDANGRARCAPVIGPVLALLTGGYSATYAGDGTFQGATAKGSIIDLLGHVL